jgi:hypothetical protein
VSPERIVNALFAHEYRIVHIAAHGHFDAARPVRSGVVIGDEIFLTALEIQQMQTTPELVFLNCCHLGRLGDDPSVLAAPAGWRPDRLASSVSRALIDVGVRAVVSAGWAIDDDAAVDFARRLYEGMLRRGDDIGVASRDARRSVWDRHGGRVNSWGAYQVYAPPAFRLSSAARPRPTVRGATSPRELRDALAQLSWAAQDAVTEAEAEAVRSDLQALLDDVAELRWAGGPEYATVGRILADLGDYEAAVAAYERAQADWGAGVSLWLFEQLANVRVKWAADVTLRAASGARVSGPSRARPAGGDGSGTVASEPDGGKLFEEARLAIERLGQLAETPERLGLLGSYWRRRAQCATTDEDRLAALEHAISAYQRADELHLSTRSCHDYYAGINAVALQWLASLHRPGDDAGTPAEAALEVLAACRALAERQRCPDYWSRATRGDAALAEHLVRGDLPEHVAEVAQLYAAAFAAGSSTLQRRSAVEHVRILGDLVPDAAGRTPLRRALTALRDHLAAWPQPPGAGPDTA